MTGKKELKPPQELVDAIQNSEDSTAPPEAAAASDLTGHNVPRTARVRLEHEDFQPMTEHQREVLESRAADCSSFMADPEERKDHLKEVRKEQEAVAAQYDRQHPGAGRSGQGQTEINSKQSIHSNERPGGKGPHFKGRNAEAR